MANPIKKKTVGILFLVTSVALALFSLTGCFNASEDDSEIPWTRPQSWEDTAPGMGGRGNTF